MNHDNLCTNQDKTDSKETFCFRVLSSLRFIQIFDVKNVVGGFDMMVRELAVRSREEKHNHFKNSNRIVQVHRVQVRRVRVIPFPPKIRSFLHHTNKKQRLR
jgi:hypothetical protein